MDRLRQLLRSLRDSKAGLQTSEARLDQRRHHGPHDDVGLIVGQKIHAPTGDTAAALWLHVERSDVMGGGNSGDQRIAIEPLRIVDRVESFDDLPTVDRFKRAELTYSCAGQAHSRDRGMPVEREWSDQ